MATASRREPGRAPGRSRPTERPPAPARAAAWRPQAPARPTARRATRRTARPARRRHRPSGRPASPRTAPLRGRRRRRRRQDGRLRRARRRRRQTRPDRHRPTRTAGRRRRAGRAARRRHGLRRPGSARRGGGRAAVAGGRARHRRRRLARQAERRRLRAQLPGAVGLGVVGAGDQRLEQRRAQRAPRVEHVGERQRAALERELGLLGDAARARQDVGLEAARARRRRRGFLAQPLQLARGGQAGAGGGALGLRQQRLRTGDLALLRIAPEERHLHAQLDHRGRGTGVVAGRGADGDVGLARGERALEQRLRGGVARVGGAHVGALVDEGGNVDRAALHVVERRPAAAGDERERRRRAEEEAQADRRAVAFQRGAAQVDGSALRLDLAARLVLRREVARLHALLGDAGQIGGAARHLLHLGDALLRGEQVEVRAERAELLLHADVGQVGVGGVGDAPRSGGAQLALVAALVGPVEADVLLDALAGEDVAAADAVLQVDLRGARRQHRVRRAVGGEDVGARGRGALPGERHVEVLARGEQRLRQAERAGGQHRLRRGGGGCEGGQEKQRTGGDDRCGRTRADGGEPHGRRLCVAARRQADRKLTKPAVPGVNTEPAGRRID